MNIHDIMGLPGVKVYLRVLSGIEPEGPHLAVLIKILHLESARLKLQNETQHTCLSCLSIPEVAHSLSWRVNV
jgi:hypothetical protein